MKYKHLSHLLLALALVTTSVVTAQDGPAPTPDPTPAPTPAPIPSGFAGQYKAIFNHEGANQHQVGDIFVTAFTSPQGKLQLTATVQIYLGEKSSNQFVTYTYKDFGWNPGTGQVTMSAPEGDVSLMGRLVPGTLKGDWFSAQKGGRVGSFIALRDAEPQAAKDSKLVKPITGFYKGKLTNVHPDSALPTDVTMSLVTTQDLSGPVPVLKVTGSTRLSWTSTQYVQANLTNPNFNLFKRKLQARIEAPDSGLFMNYDGEFSLDGVYTAKVFVDGIGGSEEGDKPGTGEAATMVLKRQN